jgi:hypothetical protein
MAMGTQRPPLVAALIAVPLLVAGTKDGAAVIKANSQHGYKALDNAFLFQDADICLNVTALEVAEPDESAGGLAFWAQDYKNAFFLTVAANGYYKIGLCAESGDKADSWKFNNLKVTNVK